MSTRFEKLEGTHSLSTNTELTRKSEEDMKEPNHKRKTPVDRGLSAKWV